MYSYDQSLITSNCDRNHILFYLCIPLDAVFAWRIMAGYQYWKLKWMKSK